MGLVVTAAIWLLFVMVALRPPLRQGRLGRFVFMLTLVVNEIPLALLAVFGVVAAVSDRPVGAPMTAAAVVLSGATAVGLLWLQLRAHAAHRALEAALARELGVAMSHGTFGAQTFRQHSARLWLHGILLPLQRRSRNVERVNNLNYGPDKAHRMDLFRAAATDTSRPVLRPVLLHLHGGGFVQGGKSREGLAMLNQLAAHGWLCFSANYRLGAAGEHPHPLSDTKRAIAWIRANAGAYGADPAQIFLAGSSAGGHLALSAALTADHPELQPGFEAGHTGVAGVVVLYGYLGARTAAASSSPAQLARPDAPPVLIVHGANDTMVSPGSTFAVAAALRSVSHCPVVYVELPHTQHSFDLFASVRARWAADAAEAFLTWARSRPG